MKTTVETMWGEGLVSVADKYVKEALGMKEGLDIEYRGQTMSISYEDLLKKNPRSASFDDKFRRKKKYSLYDFFWEIKK